MMDAKRVEITPELKKLLTTPLAQLKDNALPYELLDELYFEISVALQDYDVDCADPWTYEEPPF